MQEERAGFAQIQKGFCMCVGDLVTWKPELPLHFSKEYGIVIELVSEYLVGVLWYGSEHVYLEPVNHLEVVREKAN